MFVQESERLNTPCPLLPLWEGAAGLNPTAGLSSLGSGHAVVRWQAEPYTKR